jgi:catechol 2,3-dioxygenase
MAGISRVGHVVLYVSDIDRSIAFYRDKLGMELVRNEPGFGAFMSFGVQHHDIALFQARGPGVGAEGGVGLAHVALLADGGLAEVKALHDRLEAAGVFIEERTDHGMTQSVYFRDPDNNRLEIYCDTMPEGVAKRYLAEREGLGSPLDLNAAPRA